MGRKKIIKKSRKTISDGDIIYVDIFGDRHRENGPAFIGKNGKSWWIDGKLHREDGPAVEYKNGKVTYYLNGKELLEKYYEQEVLKLRLTKLLDL